MITGTVYYWQKELLKRGANEKLSKNSYHVDSRVLDVVQKRGGTVGVAAASSLPTAKKKYCPEEMLNFGAFCRHSIDLVKEEEEEATAWKKSFHHLAFTSVVFATIFAITWWNFSIRGRHNTGSLYKVHYFSFSMARIEVCGYLDCNTSWFTNGLFPSRKMKWENP